MAKKITLQHWYTTGSTTAPTGLIEGEIAISHATGSEAIFLKNDKNDNEVKFIPKTQIEKLINAATTGLASDDRISALTTNLSSHTNLKGIEKPGSVPTFGHVALESGDLSRITQYVDGFAASSYHTHGQYLTGVIAGSGQPIVSIIEDGVAKIGLTTGITNQISSGVLGYTRIETHEPKSGSTGEIGHVKLVGGDLSGKTGNVINGEAAASHHSHGQYIAKDDISFGLEKWKKNNDAKEMLRVKAANNGGITVDASGVSINTVLRTKWNTAADRINTFLDVETGATTALDSLHEIQEYLTGSGNSVNTLLDSLNNLTNAVSGNTDDITILKQNFETNGLVTNLVDKVNNKINSIIADDNLSANTKTIFGGAKQCTITHTSASTQNSAITAINASTGLNFGDTFKFVNNIGYDKNGHVVSGSTHELKLPKLIVTGGITGTTGTTSDGDKGLQISHANKFSGWNGKKTGVTLNFNESFKIPIIDYLEETGRNPMLSGVDMNGHLKDGMWTLTTLSLPSLPYGETGTTYGVVTLLGGDLSNSKTTVGVTGQAVKSTAAHYQHTHSVYATKADLGMMIDNGITTISCGTY